MTTAMIRPDSPSSAAVLGRNRLDNPVHLQPRGATANDKPRSSLHRHGSDGNLSSMMSRPTSPSPARPGKRMVPRQTAAPKLVRHSSLGDLRSGANQQLQQGSQAALSLPTWVRSQILQHPATLVRRNSFSETLRAKVSQAANRFPQPSKYALPLSTVDAQQVQSKSTDGALACPSSQATGKGFQQEYIGKRSKTKSIKFEDREVVFSASRPMRSTEGVANGVEDIYARWSGSLDSCSSADLGRCKVAFERFVSDGSHDIGLESIPEVLELLGHIVPNSDVVKRIMTRISDFSVIDKNEFFEFLQRYWGWEKGHLHSAFDDFVTHSVTVGDHVLPVQHLPDMLRSINTVASRQVIEEALAAAGLKKNEFLERDEFMLFLAAYRVCKGFTADEIAAAKDRFDTDAEETTPLRPKPMVKVDGLMACVLGFFGLHAVEQAKALFASLPEDEGGEDDWQDQIKLGSYVGFDEFLSWCWRLQKTLMDDMWAKFEKVCRNGRIVEAEDFRELMIQMQYSLTMDAIDEFMKNTKVSLPLDFDGFVEFWRECNKHDGFQVKEEAEFKAVYERFDYSDDGEIEAIGVIDMIHHLGHDLTSEKVHELIKQVDFNDNRCMDVHEFMRLMRLHREREMKLMCQAFTEHKAQEISATLESTVLLIKDLEPALASVGQTSVEKESLTLMLEELGNPKAGLLRRGLGSSRHVRNLLVIQNPQPFIMDPFADGHVFLDDSSHRMYPAQELHFDLFVTVVDKLRKMSVEQKRRRAGFKNSEYVIIQDMYKRYAIKTAGKWLNKGELLWLLTEMQIPIATREERDKIFTLLKDARASAAEAGIHQKELGKGDDCVPFFCFLHLLRRIARDSERAVITREELAVEETKFSNAEITEFRNIFRDWHEQGPKLKKALGTAKPRFLLEAVKSSPSKGGVGLQQRGGASTAASAPRVASIISGTVCRMSVLGVIHLLGSIGLTLNQGHKEALERQLITLSCAATGLDFADFLRMMRWMIDTNFASINGFAAKVAAGSR